MTKQNEHIILPLQLNIYQFWISSVALIIVFNEWARSLSLKIRNNVISRDMNEKCDSYYEST